MHSGINAIDNAISARFWMVCCHFGDADVSGRGMATTQRRNASYLNILVSNHKSPRVGRVDVEMRLDTT